ncbi:MAG: hypothetical protein E6L09_14340 [Verrucomicrobia bacterium]|nr:MAG: hypothetical protein E6L09_14340 [Verrucomicrobiota bacterium]
MGKINFGRVLLGGIVAGIILSVGEYVLNEKVLGAQMKTFFTAHKFAEPPGSFLPIPIGLTIVLGIVIVLGYAAIRPRFGAGAKTAIIAALFAWFGCYVYCGIINALLFGIPMNTMLIVLVWGLVEYIIAALVGAWLYKEG